MRATFGIGVVVWLGIGLAGCSARPSSDEAVSRAVAAASPIALGPEIGTDPPVPVQKDIGYNPALGTDGSGFLVVETIANLIRGVRVDASGSVLDPIWLHIGDDPPHPEIGQYYPSVAYGAGHYLVTWSQADGPFDPEHPEERVTSSVRARLVSSDGTLSGGSFVVSSGDSFYGNAAWNGSHFVLAWLGLGPQAADVHTVLLDASGAPVSGSHHVVSTSGTAGEPRVAVSAGQTFVIWYDYASPDPSQSRSAIYGARVAWDGTVLDPGGRPLGGLGYETSAAVASDRSGFLAVWEADYASIRGSLVAADGTIIARDFPISSGTGSGLPSVTFDGTDYLVAWADDRNDRSVYGVHVSTSGVVASDETRIALGSPRYTTFGSDRTGVAFNGANTLVTFLGKGIEGSLISPALEMQVGSIGLTALPNPQGYPMAVWNGDNYMVAWVNELAEWTQTSGRAVRIDGRGAILDPDGLVLSLDHTPFSLSLASSGQGSSLVAWAKSDESVSQWVRPVASAGVMSAAQPFPAENTSSVIQLAANGAGYYAVTDNWVTGMTEGWTVDAAGNAGPKVEIGGTPQSSTVFALADGYLVVTSGGAGITAVPVSTAGVFGTPFQISETRGHVQVASNGEQALVTWSSTTSPVIHAQLFEDGALVGSPFVLSERSSGFGASVAWDGSTYFTAWDLEDYTIEGRAVATDGTLGDVTPLAGAEASGPVLASDGEGQLLLSYIRWYEHAQTRRVTSRLVGRDADASPTAGSAGAASTAGSSGAASMAGSGGVGGSLENAAGAPSGGSAPVGGSASAGSGGLPDIVRELGCGVAPGRAGSHAWMGVAAALALSMLRRRRASSLGA